MALTHCHAVPVLGASAFNAGQIIMSEAARNRVAERGQEDWDSEFQRFPRLFAHPRSDPACHDLQRQDGGVPRQPPR